MKKREPFPKEVLDRLARANRALDAAHKLPHGPERAQAIKTAEERRIDDVEAYIASHDLRSPE